MVRHSVQQGVQQGGVQQGAGGWLVDSFQHMMSQVDSPSKLIYGTFIVLLIA